MSKKPLLYVDGLNFFRKAFPQALDWWNLKQFLTNVRMMVKRLEKYDLKVFIDASRVTPEARTKWKSRHETRIRKGKASPPFKETLLGDAFRICNVPVFYSYGADNDDSLASHAQRDNASILSEDQDYFRYKNSSFTIYQGFSDSKKSLKLAVVNEKRDITKRRLISPPQSLFHSPDFADVILVGVYKKGYGTPLNTYFETPHITARGLRQAVYYKLGYTKPIMEIFPYWNGGDILWTEDLVNPDPRLDYLLDNPALGVSTIMAPKMFKRPDGVTDLLWNQHLFACTMTVYNLSALASGGNKMLLEMVMPICEKYVVREDVFKQYACKSCGGLVQLSKQKYEWYKWFI